MAEHSGHGGHVADQVGPLAHHVAPIAVAVNSNAGSSHPARGRSQGSHRLQFERFGGPEYNDLVQTLNAALASAGLPVWAPRTHK
eukprot:475416-Alexandrium_andersonii.AAC.1